MGEEERTLYLKERLLQRMEHYRDVSGSRIFHTTRDFKTTCCKSVLLVFYRACAYCNVA